MATEVDDIEDRHLGHEVAVKFTYLNSNEEVEFRVPAADTLQQVWDTAYGKLEESRRQGDQLQCASGTSLMADLQLTMTELHERHICTERHFEIRSESGGA